MSNSANFFGSVPSYYDTGLGPNIFTYYAQDISQRAAELAPNSLLELAGGTGIVTQKLRADIADHVEITSTDLNQAMLDVAQGKFSPKDNVTFQTADAVNLPFDNDSFDSVICQFGIMFFPDKLQSLQEAHRVLKTGGHYIFNVWCSWAENPFARIAHETIAGFFDGAPPKFYEVPFGYHDIDEICTTVNAAGFSDVMAERIQHMAPLEDIPAFAKALVYGNPIREEILGLGGDPDKVVVAIEESLFENFGATKTMPLEAITFKARK